MGALLDAIYSNIEVVHIVLFVLGIIFLIAEMFEPGLGVCGGIGTVLMIIDVLILADNIPQGMVLIAGVVLILLLFVLIMFVLASHGVLPKKIVLSDSIEVNNELFDINSDISVGDEGVTITLLRPAGKAEIGGISRDVISDGEFIEKDAAIVVKSVHANKITVTKK